MSRRSQALLRQFQALTEIAHKRLTTAPVLSQLAASRPGRSSGAPRRHRRTRGMQLERTRP
eukprot:15035488-Alexandrium_andersonii.AAC.1